MEDMRQFVFGALPGERPNAAPSGKCEGWVKGVGVRRILIYRGTVGCSG